MDILTSLEPFKNFVTDVAGPVVKQVWQAHEYTILGGSAVILYASLLVDMRNLYASSIVDLHKEKFRYFMVKSALVVGFAAVMVFRTYQECLISDYKCKYFTCFASEMDPVCRYVHNNFRIS